MANEVKLQAVITAKDEATSKIKSAEMSFGKLAGAVGLGNIAANAFQKGLSFLTDTIGESIKAANEEQVAMVKVDAILKTLTGDLTKNSEAVTKAANAAMQLGFDDEDASIAMAKLMQVTKDTTQAQDFLNVSMDLARFKGIDLEAATQAMTMAMQGSGKILKQLGIEVPDNATKTQILGLVYDKVKGQAEAFGNTAAGAQAKLAVQIENVKEQFGNALLKGLTPFVQKLSEWISKPETQKFITELANKLGVVMSMLFKMAENALPSVIEFIDDLAGGFDALTDALADVIIFFDKLKAKWDSLPDWLRSSPLNVVKDLIGKASGGYVTGGTPYMVGERGPELFVPGQSGNIVPNNKMGGSVNINFNNPIVRSESDFNRIISEVKRVLNREQVVAGLRI